jgi:hypothetical protein
MCSKCRKRKYGFLTGERRSDYMLGTKERVRLSGRRKRIDDGRSYGRSSNFKYEYRCLRCGHVGWSRHTDIEALWLRREG